jgi:protease I
MGSQLEGRRVAILAADGVEGVELTEPRKAVEYPGAQVTLLSLEAGVIQAMNCDVDRAHDLRAERRQVVGAAA